MKSHYICFKASKNGIKLYLEKFDFSLQTIYWVDEKAKAFVFRSIESASMFMKRYPDYFKGCCFVE